MMGPTAPAASALLQLALAGQRPPPSTTPRIFRNTLPGGFSGGYTTIGMGFGKFR
jgi:hypothetical protein